MNKSSTLLTKFWSMLRTMPSVMVSSIFTFKLQLFTIALLNTIASNIFSLALTYPNLVAHIAKDIWTGDSKLGYYYNSTSTLKGSRKKRRKTPNSSRLKVVWSLSFLLKHALLFSFVYFCCTYLQVGLEVQNVYY